MNRNTLSNTCLGLLIILSLSTVANAQHQTGTFDTIKVVDRKIPESKLWLTVSSGNITVKLSDVLYKICSIEKLDAFIKDHKVSDLTYDITLDFKKRTSRRRADKVFNVLRDNNITQFNIMVK